LALTNPAHRAYLAQLAALEQRIAHDRAAAADMRRVELMTRPERALLYRQRLAALEAEPDDPAEVDRLRSMGALELVGEYNKVIRRGSPR
jgi:hypothetical protein